MVFLLLSLNNLQVRSIPRTAAPRIGCRQPLTMAPARPPRKDRVVFVMGATGTGKSRLAIDLALHLGAAEVVNSDKMQVYDGLSVVTNKVTAEECAGVPHHLLGGVHPEAEFTAADFRREAALAVGAIVARGRVPIVAGGSNSYIEELVDGGGGEFRSRYECCFLWVDVDLPVLHAFVSYRVDRMVEMGLADEARGFFAPDGDYTKGVRRAIGVPEMDRYVRSESSSPSSSASAPLGEDARRTLLESAIDEIKANTCRLACCQLRKIHRLCGLSGWNIHRVDATEVFTKRGRDVDEAWAARVSGPCINIVRKFLAAKTATTTTCTTTTTTTTTSTVPLMESSSAESSSSRGMTKKLRSQVAIVGATMA